MNHKLLSRYIFIVIILGFIGTTLISTTYAQSPAECEASDSSDWEVFEGEGVTVRLPEANWQVLSDQDIASAAEIGTEFMSDEMAFLAMFGSQGGDLLAVSSLSNPTLSLLVTVTPIPSEELTVENIANLMGLEVLEEFGMIIAEPRLTDLQSGEAYVIDVAFDEESVSFPISIFERFYLVTGEEYLFMVLFVTDENEIKDLCGDIAAVADSFTYDESAVPAFPSVADAEWITHTTEFVSVSAPETWLDRNDPNFVEMAIEMAGENNPALEGLTDMMSPDLFELFLVDPFTGVSLNVITQDLGASVPLDLLVPQLEIQYEQALQAEVISIEVVQLPAGEAIRAQIALDMTVIGGQTATIEQIQFIFIEGTQMYIFSMGGPQEFFEEYEPIFQQVAESIELLQ